MRRSDIHRPGAINPNDYEFVAFEYQKIGFFGDGVPPEVILGERAKIRAHMARTGGTYSKHEHGGNCHVCGAHAIYTVLFYHQPTNVYVRTGQICAEKMEMSMGDFNFFKQALKESRDFYTGKKKAVAILSDAGLGKCWTVYCHFNEPCAEPERCEYGHEADCMKSRREEQTIADIVGKLVKYGSMSPAQEKFLGGLLERINTRTEHEARYAAERLAAANCPIGRVTLRGEILKTKTVDTDFGEVLKMTVKTEDGFLVYGTVPSGCPEDRGAKIEFIATATPAQNDPKFGFFKRPTFSKTL